jgi:SAM-dependent methyltransferase
MIVNSAYKRGDYEWVYANYLDASHGLLEDAVRAACAFRRPEVAVDLCAGTGAMTRVLLSEGIPHVVAVDASSAMLTSFRRGLSPLDMLHSDVTLVTTDLNRNGANRFLLGEVPGGQADLLTCRQGIGYLRPLTLSHLPDLLAPGGRLLFNSFVKPPHGPWWHSRSGGIKEAGFYAFGRVFHLQARWPRFDVTHFFWHDLQGRFAPPWRKVGLKVTITQHKRTLLVEVLKP